MNKFKNKKTGYIRDINYQILTKKSKLELSNCKNKWLNNLF